MSSYNNNNNNIITIAIIIIISDYCIIANRYITVANC